jgi:hypothetical protein
MAAGFESDEERFAAGGGPGLSQSLHFAVRSAKAFVPAFADRPQLIVNDDGSHRGIRFDQTNSAARQLDGPPHHLVAAGKLASHS